MAFGDRFKATVFTEYRADIKDHERNLAKLKGKERERYEALVEQQKKINEGIDGNIAMLAKAGVAVGAVIGTYKALSASVEEYQKRSRLTAATAAVDLDGLKRATKGLATETVLLEFAAKATNGTFKLTQKQMETVAQGALALRKQGHELTDVMERVGQAVREGNVEPLKELGLIIKGAENDTEGGVLAVVQALGSEAEKMGGNFSIAGDDMTKASVEMEDAVDSLKQALGQLVVALAPVIEQIAAMAKYVADIVNGARYFFGDSYGDMAQRAARRREQEEELLALREQVAARAESALDASIARARAFESSIAAEAFSLPAPFLLRPGVTNEDVLGIRNIDGESGLGLLSRGSIEYGSKRRAGKRFNIGGQQIPELDVNRGFLDEIIRSSSFRDQGEGRIYGIEEDTRKKRKELAERIPDMQMDRYRDWLAELDRKKRNNMFEAIFGTPSDIDALSMSIDALGATMDGFVTAFGSGVDALITGSKSFGEAFKDAIAESSRALAVEFAMQALRHSLYAVGEFALGISTRDPSHFAGAAAHGKAAAGYAAGAVGVGIIARGLGAGQASAAPPRTAGAAGVGASAGAGNGGIQSSTRVQLIDETFTELPPGQREAIYRRRARRAGITFEGDAVING